MTWIDKVSKLRDTKLFSSANPRILARNKESSQNMFFFHLRQSLSSITENEFFSFYNLDGYLLSEKLSYECFIYGNANEDLAR